jgi:hypothetical protein
LFNHQHNIKGTNCGVSHSVFMSLRNTDFWAKSCRPINKAVYIAQELLAANKLTSIPHETLYTSKYKCKVNNMKLTYLLHGLSPQANYTDRATAACRRSECQLLQIEGATWSA